MKKRFLINCECGCSQKIINLDKKARPRRFVVGHHNKLKDYSKIDHSHLLKYSKKKGNIPWNKGLRPEYMQGENNYFHIHKFNNGKKISKTMKGRTPKNINLLMQKGESFRFKTENVSKEKNNNWKGGITSINAQQRFKFNQLAKDVLKRDNYTCQMCGQRGGDLHVDHIQSWKDFIELRFKVDNLRTLCVECHYKVTFRKSMPKNSNWGKNKKGGVSL